ncbi:hypothetical protein CMI48_02470 [Candidatus Pacearchaeota archaeon]|jgi:DNA-3-methyladenine glycosylase|nr:hypothetical protein [Candidatus Pacearchaeota archaeon]|tara:strand:+ start:272 stop:754 length:483 start_codon:yes stop_codon:yes gene_type:complete
MGKLPTKFFARDPVEVARDLMGRTLVREENTTREGSITEVRAYLGIGPRTGNKEGMETTQHGKIYIMPFMRHHSLNITTKSDSPSCVEIRSLHPIGNIEGETNGPGKLTKTLNIGMDLDGLPITNDELYIIGEPADRTNIELFDPQKKSENCIACYRMRR